MASNGKKYKTKQTLQKLTKKKKKQWARFWHKVVEEITQNNINASEEK